MTATTQPGDTENANICIHCGLCCDGSLFKKAVIGKDDDQVFLKELGVDIISEQNKQFFLQPCIWLAGTLCTLYQDQRRFKTCKNFKCKLLKRYLSNEISYQSALATINDIVKRRQNIKEFFEIHKTTHDKGTNASFIQILKQISKMDDLSFRKTYAKQLLDCVILEELLKRRFYHEEGKATDSCKHEDL